MMWVGDRPERLLVVSRDVTERQNAERRQAALIELGDTLRQLSEPGEITGAAARILGCALRAGRAAYAQGGEAESLVIGPNWTGDGLANMDGVVRAENFANGFVGRCWCTTRSRAPGARRRRISPAGSPIAALPQWPKPRPRRGRCSSMPNSAIA